MSSTIAKTLGDRPPASVLFIKPDTLGDLVLFSPVLDSLRKAWPDTRIGVVIRSAYRDLAGLMTSGVDWFGTEIDVFRTAPSEAERSASALADLIRAWQPDCIIAACPRRNWLDFFLAAKVPASRRIAFAETDEDPFFGAQLRRSLPEAAKQLFTEITPDNEGAPEWRRNLALTEYLVGRPVRAEMPKISLPEALLAKADSVLASFGLNPEGFVVCAAAGFANVSIKTWPADRFAASIASLEHVHGCPTLLIGQKNELAHLEAVASAAQPALPKIWTGDTGDLPLLAALIARSRLFLGNDTGAMHIAAATSRPIVAIFGGGTWPRFLPAGRQTIALTEQLPCFGCGWDCHWDNAPCLRSVTVDDVTRAVAHAWNAGAAPYNIVQEVRTISEETARVMGIGALRAKRLAAEHHSRLLKLEEIAFLAAEKDREISNLKAAADEKQDEIFSLKNESDIKDSEISNLKRAADEKDAEITALKDAADEKDTEIAALKAATETRLRENAEKEAEIRLLKKACDERLSKLNESSDNLKTLAQEYLSLKVSLEAARAAETEARTQAQETETFYRRLAPDAAQWAAQMEEAHNRIKLLDTQSATLAAEIATLKATLAERENSLQNYFNQHGVLEVNKHYQKLLRDKEDVLQVLHRACQEREAVIRKLVAESHAGTKGMRRLALGLSSWFEARIRQPWKHWSSRKILDGYWMQLGGLFQYEPRPVAWDGTVRSARCTTHKAPRIGLVTPSFNQAIFLKRTIASVLDQKYPNFRYVIQDGGSQDGSPELIKTVSEKLHAWESAPDKGQADAIRRGFDKLAAELKPGDLMGWLNSDDLLAPGALHWVGRFFDEHPEVDVIYGHRIIIDETDREVGRWVLPPHDPETLRWIDFIPQETMFWRKRAWDLVGGLDPSFHFALDWDLALRFQEAGVNIVRVPRFLGVFRVHAQQKTSAQIHTRGQEEMNRVRGRLHGPNPDPSRLDHETRRAQLAGAFYSRLLDWGIRL